jgi:hypothetical protein
MFAPMPLKAPLSCKMFAHGRQICFDKHEKWAVRNYL